MASLKSCYVWIMFLLILCMDIEAKMPTDDTAAVGAGSKDVPKMEKIEKDVPRVEKEPVKVARDVPKVERESVKIARDPVKEKTVPLSDRGQKKTVDGSGGAAMLFADELKITLERYIFGICPTSFKMQLGRSKNTSYTCDLDTEHLDLAGRFATLALRAHSAARSDCSRFGAALANTLGELARTAATRHANNAATAEANKKRKLSKAAKAKLEAKQRTALAVKKKAAAAAAKMAAKMAASAS